MDNSNTQASSSPSVTQAEIQEAMPPEYGIIETAIEEAMPPLPGMDCNVTPRHKLFSRTVVMSSQIAEMMPPEHGAAARQEVIDRILAAVRLKRVPADFDPDALYRSLRTSIWHYCAALERQSRSEKDQIEEVKKTIKIADDLGFRVNSVNSQEYIKDSTREAVSSALALLIYECELTKMSLKCRSLIDALEEKVIDPYDEMKAGLPPGALGTYTGWNPFEWLAGYFLPMDFERHFGCKPTFTRNGPYLRFAERVLKEFYVTNKGQPYAQSSIASAMDDVRHCRVRRKTRA